MAKKVKKNTQVTVMNKDHYETDLTKHTIEDLIKWRDTASKRVDKSRARMELLQKEYNSLNKRAYSDIKWIRRLHNVLAKKVFGHRDHSKAL
jgi:hypothetical protein